MPIKLIAMDMDGTLLNSYGKITEENVDALLRAREKGVIYAVNSGRYAENALIVVRESGLNCPVIGTNGAKIIDENGKCIYLDPFKPDTVKRICDYLDRKDCLYYLYGTDFLLTNQEGRRHHSEIQYGETLIREFGFRYMNGRKSFPLIAGEPILKMYICEYHDLPGMREELKQFDGIIITSSSERNIEVSPEGVDKATGLKKLADLYGISMEDTAAFGDQENDLPAIQAAGWGFAMSNADFAVKQKAGYLTLSNDQSGIAWALERYVK